MTRAVLLACLPWAGLLVVLVVLLWGLARLNSGRLELGRLRALHRDEGGAAQSLSFVLTLPFFVMIMLFILQVSQVMIGTVVVHYAAFAAARSAIVWIPARLGMEPENCIGVHVVDPEATDQVSRRAWKGPPTGGLTFLVAADGPKFRRSAAAAVMATHADLPVARPRLDSLGHGRGGRRDDERGVPGDGAGLGRHVGRSAADGEQAGLRRTSDAARVAVLPSQHGRPALAGAAGLSTSRPTRRCTSSKTRWTGRTTSR